MTPGEPPRLVVQRRPHPWLVPLSAAGAVVLLVILAWGFYYLGKARAPGNLQQAQAIQERLRDERRSLVDERRALEQEKRRLGERIAALERAADIDREATAKLRESLREMQERLSEYKKELAFYRGIVSPEEARAGVRIQRFEVIDAGEAALYRFNLVLIQAARHDRRIRGRARLRIEGVREGGPATLQWSDVALDSSSDLVFSFKYFQELTGTFRVPREFEPTLVEVEIVPSGGGSGAFTGSYDWPQLIGADT